MRQFESPTGELSPKQNAYFLLEVAALATTALENNSYRSLVRESLSLAESWLKSGFPRALDLYGFANQPNEQGIAFLESRVSSPSEKAAVISATCAYYFCVWLAYSTEKISNIPADLEAVPDVAHLECLSQAIASKVVSNSQLVTIHQKYAGIHAA